MKKMVLAGIIILLLSTILVVAEDQTAVMRDLNERLERNKAELIKEINNANKRNEELISKSIDDNFGVLDERMNNFFKGATRDTAIIMVVGFMVGFTLSQIVKIKVEQKKRKALVKKAFELETKVYNMQQQAVKLTQIVAKLQTLEKKYSQQLDQLKPRKMLSLRNVLFAVFIFGLGVSVTYLVVK